MVILARSLLISGLMHCSGSLSLLALLARLAMRLLLEDQGQEHKE
jgi:hypothetical protein